MVVVPLCEVFNETASIPSVVVDAFAGGIGGVPLEISGPRKEPVQLQGIPAIEAVDE
jgi:hypothetical protein